MRNAGRTEDRDMDEYVLAAILAGDETKPLGVVKPFDLSDDRNGGRRIRSDPARSNPIAGRPLWPLDKAGGIDFEHPRHLRSLRAGAYLDAQLGACRDSVVLSATSSGTIAEASQNFTAPPGARR